MEIREFLLAFFLFLGVTCLFFYPFFLRSYLPLPGDLLVGHYAPWNAYSFLGHALGGVPHKAQEIDVVRQLFPRKHFSIEMLKKGELPLWNPYNFSGNPHLANFQTGIFYPLNFIFFLFPFNLAWTIFIILQPFLASCFTYLLARELKISRLGSLLASITFAFCLYFTIWIEYGNVGHAILWLPLALFLVKKIIKEGRLKLFFFLALSLTFSILVGYIQATIYLFGTTFVFFFFHLFKESKLKAQDVHLKSFIFLGSLVLPFFLSSFQPFPTLEIFLQSTRGAYPPEKISDLLLPWFYPITAFASDFFGNPASRNYWYPGTYIERVSYSGVLPLFFAFLALWGRRKERIVLFFTGLAAVSFLFSLNIPPIRFFYALRIPIISTTVYTRLLSFFSFSAAILSGFGIDFWLRTKQKKPLLIFIAFFGGIYFLLWFFTVLVPMVFPHRWWITNLGISQRNLILPTAFFLAGMFILIASFWFPRRLLFWGIGAIVIFDPFFYFHKIFHKITHFFPPEFVFPETEIMKFLQENAGINHFWGYGTGYIDTNFSTFDHTFSPEDNNLLIIRRYGELMSVSDNGRIKEVISKADVVLIKGYGKEALRQNPYRQRLLDLLGVKYVLQKDEGLMDEWRPDYHTFPPEIYELIWQKGNWQVYENKAALPRIFLVGDYQLEKEGKKIIDLIFSSEFPLKERIILEVEEFLPSDFVLDEDVTGQVENLEYQPNKVKFKVSSSGNTLLFLSDNFYPGWRAEIDGKKTKIYRANYSFRTVTVPKGEHEVIFSYQPKSFLWNAILDL